MSNPSLRSLTGATHTLSPSYVRWYAARVHLRLSVLSNISTTNKQTTSQWLWFLVTNKFLISLIIASKLLLKEELHFFPPHETLSFSSVLLVHIYSRLQCPWFNPESWAQATSWTISAWVPALFPGSLHQFSDLLGLCFNQWVHQESYPNKAVKIKTKKVMSGHRLNLITKTSEI